MLLMQMNGYKQYAVMEVRGILLDTSFFIRLLNEKDPLHKNALGYYRYFLENNYTLKCSTISIAEYCVKGTYDELPLNDVQLLPFNFNHAIQAGRFAKIIFDNKKRLDIAQRNIIPNDTKLFAQADTEKNIDAFASSDEECIKILNLLKQQEKISFNVINIRVPYTTHFGLLDL
jgi:predicted nucleic acid-binding protein